ncbi:Fur family transcriptional regulator [Natronospora cellulosivora (SeqCode)]
MEKNIFEKMVDRFKNNNYKLTSQRKDILDVIIQNPEKHFSAEELYEEVKSINPDIGLATVYRTLELMCKLKIIHQLDFDNTYKRYELNLEGKHHHHLICLDCGKIIEFNDQVLESFEKNLQEEYDFNIIDHRIKFYGHCKTCK